MPIQNNRDYWIRRAELKLQKLETDQNKIEKKLKKHYKEMIKQLKKELAALRADGTLTDFQEFRMEGTIASVEVILDEMARNEEQILEEGMIQVFKDTAKIEQAGLEISFNTVNDNLIRETLKTNWSGLTFSERIWDNRRKLATKIKETMMQGLVRGDSLQTMSQHLADLLNKDFNRAMRLMHTETCWIQCEASRRQYEEDGVEQYEYLAFIDERTSDECRNLDGKIFNVEDGKPGVNMPPMHPRCRSAIMPVVESLTELKERKAAEEAAKKAEEERIRKAQENKRKKAEAEEQARLEEEARLKAEEEGRQKEEEERKKKEEEEKEAERIRLAQENKRLRAEAKKAEKERKLREEAERKAAEEQQRKQAEAEKKRKEEEKKRKEEEEKRKAAEKKAKEEEKKRKEAEKKAEEEERKRKEAEEKARKEAEANPLQVLRKKRDSGTKLTKAEKKALAALTEDDVKEQMKELSKFRVLDRDYVEKGIYKGKVKSQIWSRADRDTYDDYVQTGDSFRINRHLYQGKYGTNQKLDETVDRLTELIGRTQVKEDTQLVRFSGVDYLKSVYKDVGIKNPFGSKDMELEFEIEEVAEILNAALAGKTTVHKSFTSVSYNKDENVFTDRPIIMEIYAEKGVPALYTTNYHESELVLQRDTEFEIIGFEPVKTKDRWGYDDEQLKIILKAKAPKK